MKTNKNSSNTYTQLKTYITVGRQLHIITLIEVLLLIGIVPLIYRNNTESSLLLDGIKIYGMLYFMALPVFSQLGARSRFQNYKQMKDQLYVYGFDTRIFKPALKSSCQRDAAMVSARELGLENDCKQFFYEKGYRWYHIIPDFFWKKPQFLFSPFFWKTTFFTAYYRPRYIYKHDPDQLIYSVQAKAIAHES